MYSLDINFLNDRPEYQPPEKEPKTKAPPGAMTPLIIGAAIGLLVPGLVGAFWWFTGYRTAQLRKEEVVLDQDLQEIEAKKKEIEGIKAQINQANAEKQALVNVFNQIKPWSALLQDISDRVPEDVLITEIKQTEEAPKPPAAGTAPANAQAQNASQQSSKIIKLEISGNAKSFDKVNDFLLTLQQSPFFDKDGTQLLKAQLVEQPLKLAQEKQRSATNVKYELPKWVEYTINTNINDLTADDPQILKELDRKGAVGPVTRIRELQNIQNITE
ncbi:MAG: fimbrial assembly protein [Symploca sp. SIO2G7]|nr:fimbrial assembly protein [Symploca sp. SIO2G7]